MAIDNKWTEAEIELLKSWVGKKHLQQIIEEWNAVAKKNGWCLRNANGLKVKATRLFKGKTIRPDRDNWSTAELARRLAIPIDRPQKWIDLGLKVSQYSFDDGNRPHITCISRRNLKKFALSTPEQFWGIDPKRLSKILNDSKASKAIVAAVTQPTVGRAITVIRLDTGDVYRSARSAAVELAISVIESGHRENIKIPGKRGIVNKCPVSAGQIKGRILRCCHRDTPLFDGSDWAQLDYPIFWVPISIREEFNQLAGKALYEIYLQLRSLPGYSKTSCLVVAGRIAVQITLWAFRKNLRQKIKAEELTPKKTIVEYWQAKYLEILQNFLLYSSQQNWRRITSTVRHKAYSAFAPFFNHERNCLNIILEEYALHWIEEQTATYFKTSYLPKNYQPQTFLEQTDILAYIYCSILAQIEIKKDVRIPLIILRAWRYIDRKNLCKRTINVDLSGIEPEEFNSIAHQANTKLAVTADPAGGRLQQECGSAFRTSDDAVRYLENFINFIKESVNSKEYEILKLYLDLKLEECSDREVASAMNIVEDDVLKIEQKIKFLANQYSTQNY